MRPYLRTEAGHDSLYLQSQLLERQRKKDRDPRLSREKCETLCEKLKEKGLGVWFKL
jgi:hypothetical protein